MSKRLHSALGTIAALCASMGGVAYAQPASAPDAPPVALPEREQASAESWFARPPLTVSVGRDDRRWTATIYGFVEADVINDSTRSYPDAIGSALVARDETYAGRVGRTQFSVRNTRLGVALAAPRVGGVEGSAVLESDFFGNQPQNVSQAAYFDSPTFRIRHAYLKLEDDVVDVLAGQTYY